MFQGLAGNETSNKNPQRDGLQALTVLPCGYPCYLFSLFLFVRSVHMRSVSFPLLRPLFAGVLLCAALLASQQGLAAASDAASPPGPVVSPASRLTLEGQAIQGGLMFGEVPAGTRVKFNGRSIMVSDDGRFLIGFGRDNKSRAKLAMVYPDGRKEKHLIKVRKRQYRIQRIDGLPKGKVSGFSKADLKRIRGDSRAAKKARALRDRRLDWQQSFAWPVEGIITGVYGSQRILNGKPRRPHFGVDIARPTGTPVGAPAAGVVTLVRDMFFSGNTVIIDHGYGLSSSFLHMSKVYVKVGDRLKQGDLVGEIGATGRVTGPHLDWRMNWLDQRVDVQLLVPPMPDQATGKHD